LIGVGSSRGLSLRAMLVDWFVQTKSEANICIATARVSQNARECAWIDTATLRLMSRRFA
jgi:hypothetical protein